ncbi:PQQ-binding-like beta-propeller repeat protein [Haloarcula montana]|uniref:PQQ-binding-like beta-propeller repeat protein n=1 Tax=Haloarcula montana TaxID=3111776 RepID=UPI002D773D64|nr:PQQ-binding-like beta-propeller repeat protein [Haloarcula sp. GH36]
MNDTPTNRRGFLRAMAGLAGLVSTSGCLNLQEPTERTVTESPVRSATRRSPDRSSPTATAVSTPEVPEPARWAQRTRAPVYQPPVTASGVVLVGSTDRRLYAFDAADGTRAWVREFETQPHVSVADGTAVVLSDYRVHAVDVATGETRWENPSEASGHRPLVVDGTVFLAARAREGTRVVARSLSSGDVSWIFTERDADERTIVVNQPAYEDGVVCVAAGKGNRRPSTHSAAYGIDADSGEKRWETAIDANFGETNVAAAGGYTVSGGDGGTLRAFDATTGERAWQRSDLDVDFVGSVGERFYVGYERLVALDPSTGRTAWTFEGRDAELFSPPAVRGNTLFAPSTGPLHELSSDGRPRGTVELFDALPTGAAADGEGVYVGADDANVYAYPHPGSDP